MKKILILILLLSLTCKNKKSTLSYDFTTVFERSQGTQSATYQETISFFNDLSKTYACIDLQEIGETDSGIPLHIVTLNPDGVFDFDAIRNEKRIILINNGIHPGEPDGIDATMMLFRDIAEGKIIMPKHTVLVSIPVYNIGGSLNRNSGTRANQNGPEEYGFRGNARNYDLNRDFIKCDTKNARSFAKIFHWVKPDVFIDNHVSNGADYQYTLTHLFTQHNKLGNELGVFLHNRFQPQIEANLAQKNWDITPYVNVWNRTPDEGFTQFFDHARFSTGYTALFNTIGVMLETHMLKSYQQRVMGTYNFLESTLEVVEANAEQIKQIKNEIPSQLYNLKQYTLEWEVDSTKHSVLNFKGFKGQMITSEVTGAQRLKYNRQQPFTKGVTYYNYFKPKKEVKVPDFYIIPQGWYTVMDLLKLNDVVFEQLEKDSVFTVESYKILTYKTRTQPYEGHYLHYNTVVKSALEKVKFRKGDYIVPTRQYTFRYILETLEPEGPDSFFNWNFFDTILQRKEGFSAYVFEDTAKEMLAQNPDLRVEFETKKSKDKAFAKDWYAQLYWLYERSVHFEKAYLQYPVYRINELFNH